MRVPPRKVGTRAVNVMTAPEALAGHKLSATWWGQLWPHLSASSQLWLMEQNGEPLPDDLIAEILSVTGGEQDA